jgi:hypothetical protein
MAEVGEVKAPGGSAQGLSDDSSWAEKRKDLERILEENPGRTADVLVGMSGGKDSLYMLHMLHDEMQIKVKAFTWDHYHANPAAINSIRKAVMSLQDIEWISYGFRSDVSQALLSSYLQEVKRFCICPHFMLLRAAPMAIDEGIPFISIGYSPNQNSRKGAYSLPDPEERKRRFGAWADAFYDLTKHCLSSTFPDKAEEYLDYLFEPLFARIQTGSAQPPAILQPSHFLPWKTEDIIETIYTKHAWKKTQQNSLHSNCLFEPIRGYLEYKFGRPFLVDEAEFLVQKGEMTAEQAASALRKMNYCGEEPRILGTFLDYAKLTADEFRATLDAPMSDSAAQKLERFVSALFELQGYQGSRVGTLIR